MELSGDGKMPVMHFGMTGMLQVSITCSDVPAYNALELNISRLGDN